MTQKRPTMDEIWMNLAINISERSTCSRNKVGCVITNKDKSRVLGVGYNGNFKGGPNSCDSAIAGNCGCLHSELNALLKVVENSPNKIIYCTVSPCLSCVKMIINSGCSKVIFLEEYRLISPIDILKRAGIRVYQSKGGEVVERID